MGVDDLCCPASQRHQLCETLACLLALGEECPEDGQERADAEAYASIRRAGQTTGTQYREDVIGGEALVMTLEQQTDPAALGLRLVDEGPLAEVPEPRFMRAVAELKQARGNEDELLPEAVGLRPEILAEIFVDTRDRSQLTLQGVRSREVLELLQVGAEGIGQDEGVEPVVLSPGQAVAVAETIELFGVDGEDLVASTVQCLDDGSMWNLDGEGQGGWLGLGGEPGDQVSEACGRVDEAPGMAAAGAIEQAGFV